MITSSFIYSASLEFLREVTEGAGKTIIQRCLTDEKLLEAQPLEQIPDENKPDDEWIAARLKIRHEFRTRLVAHAQRKFKRAKKHGFYHPGDEVWVHCKPDKDFLNNWKINCTSTRDIGNDERKESERRVDAGHDSESNTEHATTSSVADSQFTRT